MSSSPRQKPYRPIGCHIVSALPCSSHSPPSSSSSSSSSTTTTSSTSTAFTILTRALPSPLLKRLPGPSSRTQHTHPALLQQCIAMNLPHHLPSYILTLPLHPNNQTHPRQLTTNEINTATSYLQLFHPGPNLDITHLTTTALSSYATFSTLPSQFQGLIPDTTRLQICLPTPLALTSVSIHPAFQAVVEPLFEDAIIRTLQIIQSALPRDRVAIQFDVSIEFDMLRSHHHQMSDQEGSIDGVEEKGWWNGSIPAGIVYRLLRLVEQVDEDVEVGFHFCPPHSPDGDIPQKEEGDGVEDVQNMARVAKAMLLGCSRRVGYFSFNLPIHGDDEEAHFEPLKELVSLLVESETELYLSLVKAGQDADETRRRVQIARRVIGTEVEFGIAMDSCLKGVSQEEEVQRDLGILRRICLGED